MSDTATIEAPVAPLQAINRRAPYAATGFLAASAALDTPEPHEDEVADEVAVDPAGAPTEEAVKTEAVEQPAVDESLFEDAAQYGFSKEQAEQLGDSLPKVLAAMDRQASLLMREQLQKGNAPAQQEQPAAVTAKAEQPASFPIEKLEFEFDPEEYTEKQIKDLGKLTEHVNKQQELIGALAQLAVANHGDLSKIASQTQSESDSSHAREWDGVFEKLPEDFTDIYGKQPVSQLPANSALLAARNKLVEEAHFLRLADHQAGRPIRATQDYATRALRLLHEDKIVATTRKSVQQDIAKQRSQAIARTSGRGGKVGTGDDRAKAVIAEYLQRMTN